MTHFVPRYISWVGGREGGIKPMKLHYSTFQWPMIFIKHTERSIICSNIICIGKWEEVERLWGRSYWSLRLVLQLKSLTLNPGSFSIDKAMFSSTVPDDRIPISLNHLKRSTGRNKTQKVVWQAPPTPQPLNEKKKNGKIRMCQLVVHVMVHPWTCITLAMDLPS